MLPSSANTYVVSFQSWLRAAISTTSSVCSVAQSTSNVAVYVVVPISVHVAGVLTADVIVALTVTLWLASLAHTLVAVHDLPSSAKSYLTVHAWFIAGTSSLVVV